MNWLYYLAEANLYLSIFYLCYCLFLNKETHYTLNRAYLLFSCVVSFVLPMLQVGLLKPVDHTVKLSPITIAPAPIAYESVTTGTVAINAPVAEVTHFTLQDGLLYTYLLIAVVLLLLFVVKLYKLIRLSRAKASITDEGYKLIYLEESGTAFSFFNYLFIGTKAPGTETIIRHELVHIRQRHSIDIILLELFKIINWFNPLIYLLQNSLKTVHEYIADEQAAANETDALAYSSFLVDNAYGISGSVITNSFFNYNLLKKRIIMLNQQRSGNMARLKYLITVPLCAVLLGVSTLSFSKTYGWVDLAPATEVTGGIDAGNITEPVADTTAAKLLSPPKRVITPKGFIVDETYYEVNKKKYFLALITAKPGVNFPERKRKMLKVYKNLSNEGGEEMLYEDYGYKFPNVETTKIQLPIPPDPIFIGGPRGQEFVDYFFARIKYPEKAKSDHVSGLVVVKFDLDEKGIIKNAAISKSAGHDFDEAVLNAFNGYKKRVSNKAESHSIAVEFHSMKGPQTRLNYTETVKKQPGYYMGRMLIVDEKLIVPKIPAPPITASAKSAQMSSKNQIQNSRTSYLFKFPPPTIITNKPVIKQVDSTASYKNVIYEAGINGPIIVANNKIVYEPNGEKGNAFILNADQIKYYGSTKVSNNTKAVDKWGDKAKNGVLELIGNYSIKQDPK